MDKKVLIAAHRGCFGGGIVENTLNAFEAALRCGADIIETDIHKTKDQQMILFHDPSPLRLLDLPGHVSDYTLSELRRDTLRNVIGERSDSRVNTLEELLTAMKGRCHINLDQCWRFMDEVYDAVAAHGMEDQALIKGRAPYDEVAAWIRSRAYVPQFIPIITCDEELEAFYALPQALRIPMVEVFFRSDDAKVISDAFMADMRARGIRVWINALSLGKGIDLSGHHDDSVSLTDAPEKGWGWLVRRGAGVIQTDWTAALRRYLDTIGA